MLQFRETGRVGGIQFKCFDRCLHMFKAEKLGDEVMFKGYLSASGFLQNFLG